MRMMIDKGNLARFGRRDKLGDLGRIDVYIGAILASPEYCLDIAPCPIDRADNCEVVNIVHQVKTPLPDQASLKADGLALSVLILNARRCRISNLFIRLCNIEYISSVHIY
jgi:hypothetical protein